MVKSSTVRQLPADIPATTINGRGQTYSRYKHTQICLCVGIPVRKDKLDHGGVECIHYKAVSSV